MRKVVIRDNVFYGDENDSKVMVMTSTTEDEAEQQVEATRAYLYSGPDLFSLSGVTLLTGKHAERWERVYRFFKMYDDFVSRMTRLFRG